SAATAPPPSARIAAATSPAPRRSSATTLAPSRARASASSRPMPWPAPVTITTLPSSAATWFASARSAWPPRRHHAREPASGVQQLAAGDDHRRAGDLDQVDPVALAHGPGEQGRGAADLDPLADL